MEYEIVEINKNDAYYENRKFLIGKKIKSDYNSEKPLEIWTKDNAWAEYSWGFWGGDVIILEDIPELFLSKDEPHTFYCIKVKEVKK